MERNTYVNIENVRNEEMRRKWQRIIDDDVDPFAPEHVQNYISGTILLESTHWYAFENDNPYPGVDHQIVIPTKAFYTDDYDLPDEVWLDFKVIKKLLRERYPTIIGGGTIMRFGNTDRSGATVVHLHGQLIIPSPGKAVPAWFGSER